jgi:DNA-binding XRE family transcriptional regulator
MAGTHRFRAGTKYHNQKYDVYSQWFNSPQGGRLDSMEGRQLVAWNLRRIRVGQGLSQERLAFDAGVDRAYLGGIERQTENPTVEILDRLANTLSVPIAEFFIEPEKRAAPPKPLRSGRRPSR